MNQRVLSSGAGVIHICWIDPGPVISARVKVESVSWPAWATNCSLYTAINLSLSVIWWPMTNMLVLDGTNWRVQIPAGESGRFFQLRMP